MDLNYQNFTGQYNLPMQTLQNVGALTASLGPMAGGYGYAGGAPSYNSNYNPSGVMGTGLMNQGIAGLNPGFSQQPQGPVKGFPNFSIQNMNGMQF
jgi:hypothetical protein